MIDIVIIAASKNKQLIDITQNAINSALNTCDNIFVVETYDNNIKYDNATMIYDIQKKGF